MNDPINVPSCFFPVQQQRAGGASQSHSSKKRPPPAAPADGASDARPKKVRREAEVGAEEKEEPLENGQLVWVLSKKRHWPAYIADDGFAAKAAASKGDGKGGLIAVHFFGEKLLGGSVHLTQLSPIETRYLERKAALLEQPKSSKCAEALLAYCANNTIQLPENNLPADLPLDAAAMASALAHAGVFSAERAYECGAELVENGVQTLAALTSLERSAFAALGIGQREEKGLLRWLRHEPPEERGEDEDEAEDRPRSKPAGSKPKKPKGAVKAKAANADGAAEHVAVKGTAKKAPPPKKVVRHETPPQLAVRMSEVRNSNPDRSCSRVSTLCAWRLCAWARSVA